MTEEFIDDIRNLKKQRDFTEGNTKQVDHLNEMIDFMNGLKDAADRAAASGAFKTFDAYIEADGESVLYTLFGFPKE